MNLAHSNKSSHGVCHNARMLPLLLAQVFNPPIIHIPPTPPPKWFETGRFWGGIGVLVALVGTGVGMTGRIVVAHICFLLAWPSGSLSLWMLCHGVFRRKKLAWVITTFLLGVILAGIDLYVTRP
jgi:hypothetical protein